MKIIVDTNIVFSGILNSNSQIGKILINSNEHFEFYSCDFLKTEILKHRAKLLKLTELAEDELNELETYITSRITFINAGIIPRKELILSRELVSDIDVYDVPFVALTKFLKGKLWSGDKVLLKGLRAKKFRNTITTQELSKLFDDYERK